MKNTAQNLKHLFRAIKHSCYDMEYYRGVRLAPWTEALRYFVSWCTLFAVIIALVTAPGILMLPSLARQQVEQRIPAEATAVMKGGQLQVSGVPTPLQLGSEKSPFTIDTSVIGLEFPAQLDKPNAVLVGRDGFFATNDSGGRQIQPFKELPNFSVTRNQVTGWLGSWGILAALGLVLIVLLGIFVGSFLSSGLFAVFGAVVALLAGRLWKLQLEYRRWLAVAFHAITLPMLTEAVFSVLGLNVPLIYPLVFFMIIVAVSMDERNRPIMALPEAKEAPSEKPPQSPATPPAEPKADK
ncbi:MAG: DUF1189 family protein [Patescibacteria group bacterium]|nr:DUF1189 family protein [Patescibacteria group bacterium]